MTVVSQGAGCEFTNFFDVDRDLVDVVWKILPPKCLTAYLRGMSIFVEARGDRSVQHDTSRCQTISVQTSATDLEVMKTSKEKNEKHDFGAD